MEKYFYSMYSYDLISVAAHASFKMEVKISHHCYDDVMCRSIDSILLLLYITKVFHGSLTAKKSLTLIMLSQLQLNNIVSYPLR